MDEKIQVAIDAVSARMYALADRFGYGTYGAVTLWKGGTARGVYENRGTVTYCSVVNYYDHYYLQSPGVQYYKYGRNPIEELDGIRKALDIFEAAAKAAIEEF